MITINIPRPSHYLIVAVIIVAVVVAATVFQGCGTVSGLTYIPDSYRVQIRPGGYYSRAEYLSGYDAYPAIVTGGYFSPVYWGDNSVGLETFVEGNDADVMYLANGTRPILSTLANQTGSTLAVDLYYTIDGKLSPTAMKNGKVWSRVLLGPFEQKNIYLLEGEMTLYVYDRGLGVSQEPVIRHDKVMVTNNYMRNSSGHIIPVMRLPN